MTRPFVIIGAGGHATVIADALLAASAEVLGFLDPDTALHGRMSCGLPVLGDDDWLAQHTPANVQLANGIGGIGRAATASLRRRVQQRLVERGWDFGGVRHPAAVVSPFATVAADAQLLAACIVQAGARVGAGCIVNTAAVVEHDVDLGDWVHVAPRAVVCGDVCVAAGCHVGAGAVVRQGLRLGPNTVIGAGAVVVKDFGGDGVLVGMPACRMEHRA